MNCNKGGTDSFMKNEYGSGSRKYPFPFLTFSNSDMYCKYMTQIMKNLEIRYFQPGDIICKELDECLEVIFILEGKYNIGFEINNIQYFCK